MSVLRQIADLTPASVDAGRQIRRVDILDSDGALLAAQRRYPAQFARARRALEGRLDQLGCGSHDEVRGLFRLAVDAALLAELVPALDPGRRAELRYALGRLRRAS